VQGQGKEKEEEEHVSSAERKATGATTAPMLMLGHIVVVVGGPTEH
jgi:hypothetical protein